MVTDPSHSLRMTFNVSLIMKPYRISSFRAEVRMLYEKTGRRLCDTERRIYYPGWRLNAFLTTSTDPSHSLRMTFYRPLSLRTGGRKRIFILFFCVIPPSQYPPSGFAGHLLINKEACPIPIFPVRIPFLNTAANPSLMFRMTPYRISSFRAEVRMLYENEEKSQHDTERRIYYSDDTLRFPLITAADPSHSFRMTFYGLLHHGSEPSSSLRVIPDRPPSEGSAGARSAIEDTRLS